jgi:hypothetical protein
MDNSNAPQWSCFGMQVHTQSTLEIFVHSSLTSGRKSMEIEEDIDVARADPAPLQPQGKQYREYKAVLIEIS